MVKYMKGKYYIYENSTKDTKNVVEDIRKYAGRFNLQETESPSCADLIISIGGDGTFLEASKLNLDANIFGVNKGTLGYLTEIEEDRINIALLDYSNGNYEIQNRMMLDYYFDGRDVNNKTLALNDIVISKRSSSTIGLDIFVDDVLINSYAADGIIVSTPTGSTGYSLSCGGPIIDPKSEMIIITPISPHTMINRSIIVSSNSKVEIKLTKARGDDGANLSIDGSFNSISTGEKITIFKAHKSIKFVSFDENNFLERIRQKMR